MTPGGAGAWCLLSPTQCADRASVRQRMRFRNTD
jgi:hypothetical protein